MKAISEVGLILPCSLLGDSHITQEKDLDLLLIDTGDLHDGTGLSDGFPLGQVDGHETNNFIMDLPYDLLTIGKCVCYALSRPGPRAHESSVVTSYMITRTRTTCTPTLYRTGTAATCRRM